MRKLRVFESISVDGYFADASGDIGWAHAARTDPEFEAWVAENANKGGDLLFGRKTYQMMEAFWPTPLPASKCRKSPRASTQLENMSHLIPSSRRGITLTY